MKAVPALVPVVWSLVGPVPEDVVDPENCVQSKSSDLSWAQPQRSTSNVQPIPAGKRKYIMLYEPRREKTKVLVSDLVRHKPGCTATEDS